MSDVVHLSKWCCHDEDETWCGSTWPYGREIATSTCTDCLHAAVKYGDEAQDRLIELQRERMAARAMR